jgi:hypothetical protein
MLNVLFYDVGMQKTSMRSNNNNNNNPFMMMMKMMTMMSLPNRKTARRCGKARFVLRILLSVWLYSGISNAFVSPSKRRTVVWRPPYETFCQQHQQQVQCWDFPRPSLSTILYDGTGYETEPITSSTDDSVGTTMETVHGASVNGAANGNLNNNNNNTSTTTNGGKEPSSSSSQHRMMMRMMIDLEEEEEVPTPTQNGGYTHTTASKAKIAAANKGKTPWNKGVSHSEEVRARIAAGVRANNRERFLQKLQDIGLTEQEYEAQQAEERRKTEEGKQARRTAKGGYRPTDETKAKISKILKEKHAKGEIKRRSTVDPSKVRRGFTHSEETRAKISEALKKRWANDPEYREKMKTHVTRTNTKPETRQRISETLKKKWRDPEFRAEMLEKMSHRDNTMQHNEDHRRKISEAMKAKWQDKEYREKTLKSIANRRGNGPASRPKTKTATKGSSSEASSSMNVVQARKAGDTPKKKRARKKAIRIAEQGEDAIVARQPRPKGAAKKTTTKNKAKGKKKEPDGSVNRLREERRDLFDLLYGDEEFDSSDEDSSTTGSNPSLDEDEVEFEFGFGDEDLDSYDPYGLEDY